MSDLERYSVLFAPTFWEWGPIQAQFERLTAPLPDALITNINIIPFVGDQCVLTLTTDDRWEIIGGTREPDEPIIDTLRRELIEEAGADYINFTPMGAWKCHSLAVKPYRPHMPHPDFYRLVGYGDVRLTGQPTSPAGAEQIASVHVVPVAEAIRRYRSIGRDDLADLVRFAHDLRQSHSG